MTIHKKRLLYLDDEAVCLSVFKQAFDDLYDVRTASSPGEARAILMISGMDRTQRVLDAVRLSAFDYLIKPCELDVLELTIERTLRHHALLQTARQHKRDLERWNAELRLRKAELENLQA